MKIALFTFFCVLAFSAFSQKSLTDTCDKAMRGTRPCRGFHIEGHIDTLSSEGFNSLLNQLHAKMTEKKELTPGEDKALIEVMNTLAWAKFDKQTYIRKRYPKLILIDELFQNYVKRLHCKYNVCIGRGFSSYFIEIKVQYLGNPYACDRYIIKDLNKKTASSKYLPGVDN